METLTAALWAINLEPPASALATWVASVEARMAEAQAAGARAACAADLGRSLTAPDHLRASLIDGLSGQSIDSRPAGH
jgi:hypothetical protein